MRILFLSPRQCWPLLSGAKLREFYLARALGTRAELTMAFFTEPGLQLPTKKELLFSHQICGVPKPRPYSPARVARGLFSRWPLSVVNYTSAEMAAVLDAVTDASSFDLVHMDSIHMAGYEQLLRRKLPKARIIYNWHNIESELMRRYSGSAPSLLRRLYASHTAGKLETLEQQILATSLGHVVCSEREQAELRKLAPDANIAVIDNGVDTGHFAAQPSGKRLSTIVFVGKMNYHPNVDAAVTFVKGVWPVVRERMPDLRLSIVGADPVPAVLALKETPGVEVTGTVPDVAPYYQESLAAIVPLRTGAGTRLKILEAMAAGVPVISTEIGAEGLAVTPGQNILLAGADDAGAWITHLERLQGPQRGELVDSALQLVRSRYDWERLGEQLWQTYQDWMQRS